MTRVRRATGDEARELGVADDGIGDEQVGRLGVDHDFGLGDFGDGQAGGSGGELPFAERGDLWVLVWGRRRRPCSRA